MFRIIFFNFFVLIILLFLFSLANPVLGNNSQTNSSGSNTLIDGNMTTNNTYSGGQTNTTNSTSTNTSTGSEIPVNSANSPSYSSMSQDVCSMGVGGSVSSTFVGISGGKHVYDKECIRLKYSKLLMDLKMNVPAITLLCQKKEIFISFMEANTPCPFQGVIGPEARALWEKYPKLRPDYEEYMARLEYMEQVDLQLIKEKAKNEPVKNPIINVHN